MLKGQTFSEGIRHLPVTLFAVVMGLFGLTMAMGAGAQVWAPLSVLATLIRLIASAVFLVLAFLYVTKAVLDFGTIKEEWRNPARLAFFPALSLSLCLFATSYATDAPWLAHIVWPVGAALQGFLAVSVISSWISHRSFQVGQLSPAWFIPAVGNVVVPLAGPALGYTDVSWLFFSGGVIFWIVLLTLVFNRLMFHDPMPEKLLPTLVILIAPPAVGFLGYVNMTGSYDGVARFLVNVAYVFAILVAVQAPKFKGLPFNLTWWALSFPVAALASASFRVAGFEQSAFYATIGFLVLALLSLIVATLFVLTLRAFLAGVFFRPE